MKKIVRSLLALALGSVTLAQPPPPAASGRPTGDVEKFSGWPSVESLSSQSGFVSLSGRFRIGLPGDIQGFEALSPEQTGTTASGQQFRWKFSEAQVTGFFLDFPDSTLTGSAEELSQISTNSKRLIVDQAPGAKLLSESAATIGGLPSAYFIYDLGTDGFVSARLFLDNKRLYKFSAIFTKRGAEDSLDTAFKSFRLITQAEVDAELQRKYEAMQPAPLPQSPVVAKLASDAADEGLKGNIKKVITESEDRSGTWSVQGRKRSSVDYYDQRGARTQRDLYDNQGHPLQITVYGYIDGKRVSNSEITSYEYDPPPMAALPGAVSAEPARRPDPRYEYSLEYKYENKKLTEFQMVHNDGRKGMRYVYKHSPNQVEELVYTDEGKLNRRYLSILDANGNEIERTDFGVVNFDIYGDRRYRYAYKFDETGNWIERTASVQVIENGVTRWQPFSISYRTIIYY